jgi:Helix-turn-helix domain
VADVSVEVIRWVWKHSRAKGSDRLVLLAIADNANDDGGNAFPGHKALMEKTLLPRSTVYDCIERLVQLGELERAEHGGGRGKRTVYRVLMENRPGSGLNPEAKQTVRDPDPSGTETVRDPDAISQQTVRDSGRNRPGFSGAYKEVEPSLEPSEDQKQPEAAPPGDAEAVVVQIKPRSGRSKPKVEEHPQARELCDLLADLIGERVGERPAYNGKWLDAARLLLTRDKNGQGYTYREVEYLIRWSQDHEFWQGNILSMPTLRTQRFKLISQIKRDQGRTRRETPHERARRESMEELDRLAAQEEAELRAAGGCLDDHRIPHHLATHAPGVAGRQDRAGHARGVRPPARRLRAR